MGSRDKVQLLGRWQKEGSGWAGLRLALPLHKPSMGRRPVRGVVASPLGHAPCHPDPVLPVGAPCMVGPDCGERWAHTAPPSSAHGTARSAALAQPSIAPSGVATMNLAPTPCSPAFLQAPTVHPSLHTGERCPQDLSLTPHPTCYLCAPEGVSAFPWGGGRCSASPAASPYSPGPAGCSQAHGCMWMHTRSMSTRRARTRLREHTCVHIHTSF